MNPLLALRTLSLLIVIVGTFVLVPKDHAAPLVRDSRIIEDEAGRKVHLPEKILRVGAVKPGALRLLLYVDGVDRVAAVESVEKRRRSKPYLMAYPELAERPSLGPPHGGDAELIASLNLDVVFSTRLSKKDADRWQKRTGVPFVVIGYGDLGENRAGLDRALRTLGKVLKREDRAEEVIGLFDEVATDLRTRTQKLSRPQQKKVYVAGVAYRGAHGAASTEPKYEPFTLLGVKNVAQDVSDTHAFVDREMLVLWNPDTLFVDQASTPMVLRDLERPEFSKLHAVRKNEVHGLLPYNWYWINFGTVMANAYAVGKVIFPKGFQDIDPANRAREIYTQLLGRDVYDQMRETYGGYNVIEAS